MTYFVVETDMYSTGLPKECFLNSKRQQGQTLKQVHTGSGRKTDQIPMEIIVNPTPPSLTVSESSGQTGFKDSNLMWNLEERVQSYISLL